MKQCKNCPFKVGANLEKIPTYNRELHEKLCESVEKMADSQQTYYMLCHHDNPKSDRRRLCAGHIFNKLHTQKDVNFIVRVAQMVDLGNVKVFGAQHEKLRDSIKDWI